MTMINNNDATICNERLSEIIKIEKIRILEEFKTKDHVLCESYNTWGLIHRAEWIYKDDDLDLELEAITRERGFVCFKSTPNYVNIIKAAVLVHYGDINFNPCIS